MSLSSHERNNSKGYLEQADHKDHTSQYREHKIFNRETIYLSMVSMGVLEIY